MPDFIVRLSETLSRSLLWFASAGLIAMTAIIGWQVFARYVLQDSPAWAEQAALLLMIWFIVPAAAIGVREGFHIRIEAVQDRLRGRSLGAVQLFCHLLVAANGVALAIWGTELVLYTWAHEIPTLNLPRGFAYLPLPASGVLIALFAIEHMIAMATGRPVKPLWT